LQMATIGHAFDEKPQSRFFLSALQQKGIEVDRFVDRLDSVAVKDLLPEELTLTELILRIKDIRSLQPSSTDLIHRYVRPTDGRGNSTSRQNRPPPSSDSRSFRPPQPDSQPLLTKHLQNDANLTSSSLVSERWRIANEQNSRSARSTFRAIRAMLPEEMADRTDDELMEYYKVDDTLSDFV
jgi:hypothetical protein